MIESLRTCSPFNTVVGGGLGQTRGEYYAYGWLCDHVTIVWLYLLGAMYGC
jgi:hypothetical protein